SNETPSDAGGDASSDAPNACNVVTTDASFTCDVSAVPVADRGCNKWIGAASTQGGGFSCPATVGWSGSGGETCEYIWQKSGPPDLCQLPMADDGRKAFGWLTPECDNGCDASIDVAPPTPCSTTADCAGDEYCELQGNCAGSGTCFPKNGGGVGVKQQACGCDGKTYDSYDSAHQAGVSVAYAGACE
ncbi:MAG TPA: hypothetical protein VH054_02930, partial [Polyangiaceae bacterium]|nr:hypothetical protein [Polyangiaceae bacterium]